MSNNSRIIFAVDPGKKGAIACHIPGEPEEVAVYSTTADMVQFITERIETAFLEHHITEATAYLEAVHSSPQAGPKQSFTFGQNFGEWLGIFAALRIQTNLVKPQQWQRLIPGRAGKTGSDLKNVLKGHAQRKFPAHKITLTNADALLILDYAINR